MAARKRGAPNGVMICRDIVWEWDMRYKLTLFEHPTMQGLRVGQCVAVFNKRLTLCRVINGKGEMIEMRSDRDHIWDQDRCIQRLAAGWNIRLNVGAEVLQLQPPAKKAVRSKKAAARKAPRRNRRAA